MEMTIVQAKEEAQRIKRLIDVECIAFKRATGCDLQIMKYPSDEKAEVKYRGDA